MRKLFLMTAMLLLMTSSIYPAFLLVPMDDSQKDHLKAYGITYWTLQNQVEAWWLLNFRGGSFLMPYLKDIENECVIRGVSYEIIADAQKNAIFDEISQPDVNMDAVKLEKAPKLQCMRLPVSYLGMMLLL